MRGNTCRACCQMVFKTGGIWRMNNDHKTVREALEFYADCADIEVNGQCLAKEALAALDRIEATQPPQATDAQAQSDTGLRYCPKCDYGYTEGENCRCQQPKAAAKDKLETEPKVLQIYGAYYIGPKHGFSSEKEARDWIKSLKGSKQ